MNSVFFPHINIPALIQRATEVANIYEQLPTVVTPLVTSIKDVVWAGEKMIEITTNSNHTSRVLLAHFPRARPEHMVSAAISNQESILFSGVDTPRIYDFDCNPSNPIGAPYILIDKVPGVSLDILWDSLSNKQRKAVIKQLGRILLKLSEELPRLPEFFGSMCYDDTLEEGYKLGPNLNRAYNQGCLINSPPPPPPTSCRHYLSHLVKRVEKVFKPFTQEGTTTNIIDSGWPDKPTLTAAEATLILNTWRKLARLIPYIQKGRYLRPGLPNRELILRALCDDDGVLHHTDLQMHRIVVDMSNKKKPTLYITGWEHMLFVPVWSATRLPPWLDPCPLQQPPKTLTLAEQEKMQRFILRCIGTDPDHVTCSDEWLFLFTHGQQARRLESMLSAHWMQRDAVEEFLVLFKEWSLLLNPGGSFPVPVWDHRAPRLWGPEEEELTSVGPSETQWDIGVVVPGLVQVFPNLDIATPADAATEAIAADTDGAKQEMKTPSSDSKLRGTSSKEPHQLSGPGIPLASTSKNSKSLSRFKSFCRPFKSKKSSRK